MIYEVLYVCVIVMYCICMCVWPFDVCMHRNVMWLCKCDFFSSVYLCVSFVSGKLMPSVNCPIQNTIYYCHIVSSLLR